MRAATALTSLLAVPLALAAPLKANSIAEANVPGKDYSIKFGIPPEDYCLKWRIEQTTPRRKTNKNPHPGKHIQCTQGLAREVLRQLTAEIRGESPLKDPEGFDADTTKALKALREMTIRANLYNEYREGIKSYQLPKAPWDVNDVGYRSRKDAIKSFEDEVAALDKAVMDEDYRATHPNIMDTMLRREMLLMMINWLKGAQPPVILSTYAGDDHLVRFVAGHPVWDPQF